MSNNGSLTYLVYTSTATDLFREEQLIDLLRASRLANERRDVTGALLYRNGIFVQMLEGPEHEVQAVREKIYRDPRHSGILTLLHGTAELRIFSEWTMHFISTDERSTAASEAAYRCLKGTGDLEDMLEASNQYRISSSNDELHPGLRLLLTFRQII